MLLSELYCKVRNCKNINTPLNPPKLLIGFSFRWYYKRKVFCWFNFQSSLQGNYNCTWNLIKIIIVTKGNTFKVTFLHCDFSSLEIQQLRHSEDLVQASVIKALNLWKNVQCVCLPDVSVCVFVCGGAYMCI